MSLHAGGWTALVYRLPSPKPTPSPSITNGGSGSAAAPPADFWGPIGQTIGQAFTNNVAQTVIALLALILSVVALWSQLSHGRKAQVSVQFAKTPDYKGRADRLLVVNHGAATAEDIKVNLKTKDSDDWKPYENYGDPFPIEKLASGAAFYVELFVRPDQAGWALASVDWKDRRLRRQSWTSSVSTTGPHLGGQSLENFYSEKQRDMARQLGF